MIRIETDRIYVCYVRTNRRVQWRYSEYCGRYKTIEECITVAQTRLGNVPFEYRIENMADDSISTGFCNWHSK